MKNLVIVESPTKAKTIGRFLGKDYVIKSSYGHVRDLPKSKMGIDFEHDFEPHYVVPLKAKQHVTELKKLAAKADAVYFATDSDREGEAISWHLQQLFGMPDDQVRRIIFHEVTKKAILDALAHPSKLNLNLVNAQQARRVLDRLVGYELSPLLWKKVARGLSAGRVQSVAMRLIVEREEEIKKFKPQEYWTVEGIAQKSDAEFKVSLHQINDTKLKKFDLSAAEAKKATDAITGKTLRTTDVASKTVVKSAPPPFTTSTLQIESNHAFGFSAKQTMVVAQQLYEGLELGDKGQTGLITYMRTDSLNLAAEFIREAHAYLKEMLGDRYALAEGRHFKSKSKNVQEAHEAIRPTDVTLDPQSIKQYLDTQQFKLYELIWKRSLASQMPNSMHEATVVLLQPEGTAYLLKATGSVVKFDGWQKMYTQRTTEALPALVVGDTALLKSIQALQHTTEPPARYSEAGLVKALDERGIGRPSTYAPTIATIVERSYVEKKQGRLHPTSIGILVNDLLVKHFPDIIDYDFTAAMERDLDAIASGEKQWQPVIKDFYYPFKEGVEKKEKELSKKEITEEKTDQVCDVCGKPMVIKLGRFGKFLACTGFPECKNTKRLDGNNEVETTDERCEKCGRPMVIKFGRYGKFLACSGYPECKNIKSHSVSTGVACPSCGQGTIVEKKSKRGRIFFSCNRYPACEFALWNRPTGEHCPECGSLLSIDAKEKIRCSNKNCMYLKLSVKPEA